MELYTTVIQILILFAFIAVGYIARRVNVVDHSFSKNLSNFMYNIGHPEKPVNHYKH